MNGAAEIVIRGVLDKIEEKNTTENQARCIRKALDTLCGGRWNVVTYPVYESEKGFTPSHFNWRNKQWVYAEQTTCTAFNSSEIESFMDTEFGWARIKDVGVAQQAAHTKINNKFPGTWRVHVAKLKNGYSSSLCGTPWESDGFIFFIYRIA